MPAGLRRTPVNCSEFLAPHPAMEAENNVDRSRAERLRSLASRRDAFSFGSLAEV